MSLSEDTPFAALCEVHAECQCLVVCLARAVGQDSLAVHAFGKAINVPFNI